ncbi:hypothetical protein TNCV_2310421 [Trichonephila clavipes]|nr:hypothetical protein TNCV_2310421 [Trichonephila clavipes]
MMVTVYSYVAIVLEAGKQRSILEKLGHVTSFGSSRLAVELKLVCCRSTCSQILSQWTRSPPGVAGSIEHLESFPSNDLGGGFKATAYLCQDNPKDVLSDSGLESSWPFHSFQTVILQILLNNPSSVRSCIIIHQNEVVTIASSIWADMDQDLIPISKTSYGSPWNTCRSVWPPSEILPKPGFHHTL